MSKTKEKQLEAIAAESERIHYWECPVCGDEHRSESYETVQEFAEQLYEDGVRHVVMEYMEGVFCESCHTDPEVQNSSL